MGVSGVWAGRRSGRLSPLTPRSLALRTAVGAGAAPAASGSRGVHDSYTVFANRGQGRPVPLGGSSRRLAMNARLRPLRIAALVSSLSLAALFVVSRVWS